MKVTFFFVLLLISIWVLPVCAQSSEVPVGGVESIINVVVSLAIVLGIIFLCAWLIRKTQAGNFANNSLIKLLATQILGTKEKLVLVAVGDKQLLIGVTANSIRVLSEVEGEPQNSEAATQESSSAYDFSEQIRKILSSNPGVKGD